MCTLQLLASCPAALQRIGGSSYWQQLLAAAAVAWPASGNAWAARRAKRCVRVCLCLCLCLCVRARAAYCLILLNL